MRPLSFDPRTKLLAALAPFLLYFFEYSTLGEMLVMASFLLPYALSKRWASFFHFAAFYIFQLLVAHYVLPEISSPFFIYILSMLSIGFRRLLPSAIAGWYMIQTTSAGEFSAALNLLRVPRFMALPAVVMVRFVPTVRHDLKDLKDSLRQRQLVTSVWDLLFHPGRLIEYVLVPVLMNMTRTGEELTVSALTRGLSRTNPKTSLVQLQFRQADFIYLVILVLIIIICSQEFWRWIG